MNIFSQEDFTGVQEVIKNVNGQKERTILKNEAPKDEISELNQQSQHIQELIEEIDSLGDSEARELMQECIREILSFYGHGLERILRIISNGSNSAAKEIYNNLIDDSFLSGLLLIHDLHPLDLRTRLHLALEKVKPYMDSHGGSVEIVSLENGVAKLKLSGSCKGCPSSSSTLELGIKQAIEEHCPDLVELEVEGAPASAIAGTSSGKQTAWIELKGVDALPKGAMKALEVSGIPVVVCRFNQQLYAYRNFCPACERTFSNGTFTERIIACQLGHRYDVQQAGKCTDDENIHLDPFPLIQEKGMLKIGVGGYN
jgi:Fe-S cluster biogenesis protein NfuA/nitrite reductase/ring-hydroxylating ferredoxin subunit